MKLSPVKVWTWAIRGHRYGYVLCLFVFPTKRDLLADGKPSPEAIPVRVSMHPVERARKVRR